VPERPRAVLAATLEPGHDAVGRDDVRGRFGDVIGTLVGDGRVAEPPPELLVRPHPPEGGGRHGVDGVPELAGDEESGPQGCPGVAGRRLHPDALEGPPLVEVRVRHAVERDAARHREVRVAGPVVQPAGELEKDFLQARLQRGGEVGVDGRPICVRPEPRREARQVELLPLDDESSGSGDPDRLAEVAQERRPPVRGHRHDLVLVGRAPEAEVLGHVLVEEPERVRELLRRERLELAVDVATCEVGGSFSAPIEHHHARARKGAGKMRRGGVRQVVRDEADPFGLEAGEHRLKEPRRPPRVESAESLPGVGRDVAVRLGREIGVVGVRDRVELRRREPGPGQAPGRGAFRKLPGREGGRRLAVLATAEPLLLGGGHDLPVDNQRGRGIVEDRVHSEDAHIRVFASSSAPASRRGMGGRS
jgi:hypothetical protein